MDKPESIDQIVPSFTHHDAIGNHARLLQKLIEKRGFKSRIFYEIFREETAGESIPNERFQSAPSDGAVLIYHHSIGAKAPVYLMTNQCLRVLMYHNITPPEYFVPHLERETFEACRDGIRQLIPLQMSCDLAWGVSQYNCDDLLRLNFHNVSPFPLLRDYQSLKRLPVSGSEGNDRSVFNILFVGRVSRHKGQHDLIDLLAACCALNRGVRFNLTLVGGASPYYLSDLWTRAQSLGLKVQWIKESKRMGAHDPDIVYYERVSDAELAREYSRADVFVCMSEHEGFCVPLVEAMTFGIPVLANRAAAIPETCGSGARILDKGKEFNAFVEHVIALTSEHYSQGWSERAKARARDFSWDKLESECNAKIDQLLSVYARLRS